MQINRAELMIFFPISPDSSIKLGGIDVFYA